MGSAYRELSLPAPASLLRFIDGYLAVAYESTFTLYDCEKLRPKTLIAQGFESIAFALPVNAMKHELQPITVLDATQSGAAARELLLCFNKVGVFVTEVGYPAREKPYIKWRVDAVAFRLESGLLLCIGEGIVEVLDVVSGATKQVVHLPGLELCSSEQLLFLARLPELTYVVQLWPTQEQPYFSLSLVNRAHLQSNSSLRNLPTKASSRRSTFSSLGTRRSSRAPPMERLDSRVISTPRDFVHLQHRGTDSSFSAADMPSGSREKLSVPVHLSLTDARSSTASSSFGGGGGGNGSPGASLRASQSYHQQQQQQQQREPATPPRHEQPHGSPERTVTRAGTTQRRTAYETAAADGGEKTPGAVSPKGQDDGFGKLASLVNDPNTRFSELYKAMSRKSLLEDDDADAGSYRSDGRSAGHHSDVSSDLV